MGRNVKLQGSGTRVDWVEESHFLSGSPCAFLGIDFHNHTPDLELVTTSALKLLFNTFMKTRELTFCI